MGRKTASLKMASGIPAISKRSAKVSPLGVKRGSSKPTQPNLRNSSVPSCTRHSNYSKTRVVMTYSKKWPIQYVKENLFETPETPLDESTSLADGKGKWTALIFYWSFIIFYFYIMLYFYFIINLLFIYQPTILIQISATAIWFCKSFPNK